MKRRRLRRMMDSASARYHRRAQGALPADRRRLHPLPAHGRPAARVGKFRDVTRDQADMWLRSWPDAINTGILCRDTPTFDIDILNPEAASAVEDMVRKCFEDATVCRCASANRRSAPSCSGRRGVQEAVCRLRSAQEGGKEDSWSSWVTGSRSSCMESIPTPTSRTNGSAVSRAGWRARPATGHGGGGARTVRCRHRPAGQGSRVCIKQKSSGKSGNGGASERGPASTTEGFFTNVNQLALGNNSKWVPALFGDKAKLYESTGEWRITSKDLGRDLEEDLSISRRGAWDYGLEAGHPDRRRLAVRPEEFMPPAGRPTRHCGCASGWGSIPRDLDGKGVPAPQHTTLREMAARRRPNRARKNTGRLSSPRTHWR